MYPAESHTSAIHHDHTGEYTLHPSNGHHANHHAVYDWILHHVADHLQVKCQHQVAAIVVVAVATGAEVVLAG